MDSDIASSYVRLELQCRRLEELRAKLHASAVFNTKDDGVLYREIDRLETVLYHMVEEMSPAEKEHVDVILEKALRQKVIDDAVRDGHLVLEEDGDILSQLRGTTETSESQ